MDYRCPVCRTNLARRKLSQAIIARMEIDCPRCKSRIRLNLHPAELAVAALNIGIVVVLAVLAYLLKSQALALYALGAAALGALAFPVLERTYLRAWPRYAAV